MGASAHELGNGRRKNTMRISKSDVLATGMPRFVGWNGVPADFKTKTKWRDEGMKLKAEYEHVPYTG